MKSQNSLNPTRNAIAAGICIGSAIGGFGSLTLAEYVKDAFHLSNYLQATVFIWLGITGITFVIWRIFVLFNKFTRYT